MFCQLDALRQCLSSSLRRTLAELLESLDKTYERIVLDIKKGNHADAYRMLQCIVVAIRPLTVAELAELLAFKFDTVKGGLCASFPLLAEVVGDGGRAALMLEMCEGVMHCPAWMALRGRTE